MPENEPKPSIPKENKWISPFEEGRVQPEQVRLWDAYTAETDPTKKNEICGKIAELNMGMVTAIIQGYYSHKSQDIQEDLKIEGFIGLKKAIKKFDPTIANFSTYAHYWIRKSIDQYLGDCATTIRVPAYMRLILNQLRKEEEKFAAQHGRSPNDDELAGALGMSPDYLETIRQASDGSTVSSNSPIGNTGVEIQDRFTDQRSNPFEELFGDQNFDDVDIDLILEAIKSLPDERMEDMLKMNYSGRSFEEIGSKYNLTKRDVRFILQKAMRHLRYSLVQEEKPVISPKWAKNSFSDGNLGGISTNPEMILPAANKQPENILEKAKYAPEIPLELHITRSRINLIDSFQLIQNGKLVNTRKLPRFGDSSLGRTLTFLIDHFPPGGKFHGGRLHHNVYEKYQIINDTASALSILKRLHIVEKVGHSDWRLTLSKIVVADRHLPQIEEDDW